jgi:hypothetical protein
MQEWDAKIAVAVQQVEDGVDGASAVDRDDSRLSVVTRLQDMIEDDDLIGPMPLVLRGTVQPHLADEPCLREISIELAQLRLSLASELRVEAQCGPDDRTAFREPGGALPCRRRCGHREESDAASLGFVGNGMWRWIEVKVAVKIDHRRP